MEGALNQKKRPVLICGTEFRAQDLDYIFQNIPHHAFRDCRTAIGPHNFATILQCYCNVEFSCNDSCRYLHPREIHLAKSQSLCESRCASSTLPSRILQPLLFLPSTISDLRFCEAVIRQNYELLVISHTTISITNQLRISATCPCHAPTTSPELV